jgi:hypothetical protein
MTEHIPNIGAAGARRRWIGGYVWGLIAAGAFIVLLAEHSPRWPRLFLVLPIALSALGFLQAHEKT